MAHTTARHTTRTAMLLALLCIAPGTAAAQQTQQAQQAHAGKAQAPDKEQPTLQEMGLRGRVKSITALQQYQGGNDMTTQEEWLFDTAGRLTSHAKTGFGGTHVTTYPRPAENGRKQKITRADDGDILQLTQYAADGRMLSSAHYIYAADGTLAATVTYYYDDDGGDNAVNGHAETYFDKKGRRSSVTQYAADDAKQMEERCTYNRRGDLAKRVQTFYHGKDRETATERHRYTYDRHGNWTRHTFIHNGKAYYTVIRTITYYQ